MHNTLVTEATAGSSLRPAARDPRRRCLPRAWPRLALACSRPVAGAGAAALPARPRARLALAPVCRLRTATARPSSRGASAAGFLAARKWAFRIGCKGFLGSFGWREIRRRPSSGARAAGPRAVASACSSCPCRGRRLVEQRRGRSRLAAPVARWWFPRVRAPRPR